MVIEMLNVTNKYLPLSGGRYTVSQYGVVYANGIQITAQTTDGKPTVNLEWVLGKLDYPLALVVLIAYTPIALPERLWGNIEALFIDGDVNNTTPVNITYRFKHPIQVDGLDGYYYIPFYENYAINTDGSMVNVNSGKELTWWVTKPQPSKNSTGGYHSSRVMCGDKGRSTMLFRHKALCLTFKPYGSNVNTLIVNHLDGVPSNDNLNNLEWSNYSSNNQHAYNSGLRPNAANPILMKQLETGVITRFESVEACARHLGKTNGFYINYRLKNSRGKVFDDMLQFKYDDGTEWPAINMQALKICRHGSLSDYVARNVFTGELTFFRGFSDGERVTGVKGETIRRHVSVCERLPVGGFNFRYLNTGSIVWPNHTSRHLQIYKQYPYKSPNGFISTCVSTGVEHFYTSIDDACQELGIAKRSLASSACNNTVLNGYRYSYFKIRETLGPTG